MNAIETSLGLEHDAVVIGTHPLEPEVSVVIPNYHHGRYAKPLLQALARQEGDIGLEVILVDDGSRDDSFQQILAAARETGVSCRALRLYRNQGRATARNLGIAYARAPIVAFTDADCVPDQAWLREAMKVFAATGAVAVQGKTLPAKEGSKPFFSHFIEITRFDGTFSTCNMLYRTDILRTVGGFDGSVVYWEDVDLGWRVHDQSASVAFAPEATVYHQVIPLRPLEWLRWPFHFSFMPQKTRRYPEYRRYLFLGIWVEPLHALFDLALLGLVLACLAHPGFLLLLLPYVIGFAKARGLTGRWPPVKALFHLAWDSVAFAVLLASSLRYRSLVL